MRASGRSEQAIARLEKRLEVHPFEGDVAAALVAFDLERDLATPTTLDRARRAARLAGGAERYDQLSQVYARLDRPEEAEKAAAAAAALREREEAASDTDG